MKKILCVLFLFFSFLVKGQEKFALNDPRNPECPCHQLQRQADKEFADLRKKDAGQSKAVAVRRKNKMLARLIFRCRNRMHNAYKLHPDYSVCYKW
jgi:hypothetical protein